MKKKLLKKYTIFLIISLFIVLTGYYYYEHLNIQSIMKIINGDGISFNYDSGFYDKSLNIRLAKNIEVPSTAKLYYTLDGNDPNKNSYQYHDMDGIDLLLDEEIKVYTLKVAIEYHNEFSEIYDRTYVIAKNVNDLFDLDLISITTDQSNLYDYEKGIFVQGITHDQNPSDKYSGNYNQRGVEWERNAKISMFSSKGEQILNQDILLAVSGGVSSSMFEKSLKIKALDGEKINISLSDEVYSNLNYINEYNSLRLRSGSQDLYEGANIRSSVGSSLAKDANFDGIPNSRRTILYINSVFYGIYDIQENYSDSYLKDKYNLDSDSVVVKTKGSENVSLSRLLNDYSAESFERSLDVDNYLFYSAIEILFNNSDWPQNNFESWHCSDVNSTNKYCDGKSRFLIYDLDLIYNKYAGDTFFECDSSDVFEAILNSTCRAYDNKLVTLLKNKKYRDKFVAIVLDLLNTSFRTENVINTINNEYAKVSNMYKLYYDDERIKTFDNFVEIMRKSATDRESEMLNLFKKYYGLSKMYNLALSTSDGIEVYWNNMQIFDNENYINNYYKDIEIVYNYNLYPGYEFEYWLVNDIKVYSTSLVINSASLKGNSLKIKAVAKQKDNADLIISEVSAGSDSDWLKIYNPTKKDINLSYYYLSDSSNNLLKYQLPNITLKKGESIIINGSKNYYSIGDYIANFSINDNTENIYLTYNNNIIDQFFIPNMSKYETYGRYKNSSNFVYYNNIDGIRKK